MASERTFNEVMWAWYRVTKTWPPSKAVAMQGVQQGGDIRMLENWLRVNHVHGVSGGIPSWAIQELATESGSFAAYLTIPELAPIILQSASEAWSPAKTQAALEATSYWKNTTSRQRDWKLATPAEQAQTKSQWEVSIVETLQSIWGPTLAKQKGYVLGNPLVKQWADELASGKKTLDIFTFAHKQAAQGIKGTPANTALLEEFRQAGSAEVEQENIRGDLEDEWRSWLGDSVAIPSNVKAWSENIYMNKRSRQDFEDYVKSVSAQLYPGKPENVTYSDWVAPAKQLVTQWLELSTVDDDDPLVRAFVNGDSNLTEIALRARQDPRFQSTERARTGISKLAFAITDRWGVT